MPIDPNVYCAFCGSILLPDPYVEDGATEPETPPRRRRPWCSEVRGLTTFEDLAPPSLTGVGLLYPQKRLSAPHGCDLTYLDHELSGEWGLRTTRWASWAFGVHDACWQILRLRLRGWHERQIVTSAFHQLLCFPCIKTCWFGFYHDHDEGFRWADPFAVPLTDLSEAAKSLPSTSVGYVQVESCQALGPLYTELIHEIFCYLPCKEVAALRLVNKSLAAIAAVENLPQSYWRSRFFPGQEADFVFPILSERRDWRALFFGLNQLLRNSESLPLLTRKKIRNLIEPFARVLENTHVPWTGLFGMLALQSPNHKSRFQIPTSDDAVQEPVVLEESNSLAGGITSDNPLEPISYGCRVIDHKTWELPKSRQYDQGTIAVSTLHVGAMTFITGIGIFPSATSEGDACIIGFHNPVAARWLQMPTSSSIAHIHVAFSAQGLTGVMFSFTNGTSSHWTGTSEGPGIAQGSLNVAWKSQPRHLLAAIDVWPGPLRTLSGALTIHI